MILKNISDLPSWRLEHCVLQSTLLHGSAEWAALRTRERQQAEGVDAAKRRRRRPGGVTTKWEGVLYAWDNNWWRRQLSDNDYKDFEASALKKIGVRVDSEKRPAAVGWREEGEDVRRDEGNDEHGEGERGDVSDKARARRGERHVDLLHTRASPSTIRAGHAAHFQGLRFGGAGRTKSSSYA